MSFRLHEPAPVTSPPEFDCIFCEKPALRSSEAARSGEVSTVEVFCRQCGARKTIAIKPDAAGKYWTIA